MLVVESAGEYDRKADIRTRRISASCGRPVAPDAATHQNTHHPARDHRVGRLVLAPGELQRRVARDPRGGTVGSRAGIRHEHLDLRSARLALAISAAADWRRALPQ